MHKLLVAILFLIITITSAKDISPAKAQKLSAKGEKIVKVLCDKSKLPLEEGNLEQLIEDIKNSKACPDLSSSKLKAVAYFINNGSTKQTGEKIDVPEKAKCPVCGMFVSKYPKWSALMEIEGKKHYFDGVKDMMKFYIFDADFPYDRERVKTFVVSDFYTLNTIPAKKAFYVIGSDIFGPMGDELIPFSTEKAAKNFFMDHNGKKIVTFDKITPKMVMELDGIEYDK